MVVNSGYSGQKPKIRVPQLFKHINFLSGSNLCHFDLQEGAFHCGQLLMEIAWNFATFQELLDSLCSHRNSSSRALRSGGHMLECSDTIRVRYVCCDLWKVGMMTAETPFLRTGFAVRP
jgi:hypothetical protein